MGRTGCRICVVSIKRFYVSTMRNLFLSLIQPILDYGSIVLEPYQEIYKEKIETVKFEFSQESKMKNS